MADADVRHALYAAYHELERGVVDLILDESPDAAAATAQLNQLQPRHRPIVWPQAHAKKAAGKRPAPAPAPKAAPAPRGPQLPPPNAALPSRGWWPVAAGAATGHELSEREAATLAFLCEMFPGVEAASAAAVLAEAGGDVAAAVALLAALDAARAPDALALADADDAEAEAELPPEPAAQAPARADDEAGAEAFPALKRAAGGAPATRQARKAAARLAELFPLLPAAALHAALQRHEWDAAAAAEELLAEGEGGAAAGGEEAGGGRGGKRMTWNEVARLVKCPPPRPWGQLLKPAQQAPPPPIVPAAPPPAAAAGPASIEKSDLSTQLKWRMLRAQVPWVEEEVLESVWVFSQYSLLRTLHALAALYPEPFALGRLPPLAAPSPAPAPAPAPSHSPAPPRTAAAAVAVAVADARAAPPPSAHAAKDLAARRHLLCHAAAQAFVAGNGARAKQLAAEAREASESLRSAHEARWRAAHTQASRRGAPLLEVDLHGLTVDDALDVVSRVVAHMRQALHEDAARPRLLSLITGVGKHSAGGVARIRPALLAHLKREGLSFNEARTGHIVVRVASV